MMTGERFASRSGKNVIENQSVASFVIRQRIIDLLNLEANSHLLVREVEKRSP